MAETFNMLWEGLKEFEASTVELSTRMSLAGRKGVTEGAAEVEKQAKDRAPVKTGMLRGSIQHTKAAPFGAGGWKSEAYPSIIYSRRIELGFHGADSKGRHFNQDGKPYFAPAFHAVDFGRIFGKHWREALG